MPTRQRAARRAPAPLNLPAAPPPLPASRPLPTFGDALPAVHGAESAASYILAYLYGGLGLRMLHSAGRYHRWDVDTSQWAVMSKAELEAVVYQVFESRGKKLDEYSARCGVSRYLPIRPTPALVQKTLWHLRMKAAWPPVQVLP